MTPPAVAARIAQLRRWATMLRLDASGEHGRMPAGDMYQLADALDTEAALLVDAEGPRDVELLKRVVIAWDTDESLEFLAAMRKARKRLGLKLAEQKDDRDEVDALKANGYTEDGEPAAVDAEGRAPRGTPEKAG